MQVDDQYQQHQQQRPPLSTLPLRNYFDQGLVSILLQGLTRVSMERPENPVEFLGHFLLEHKDEVHRPPASQTAAASLPQ
ncbi:hypothetical protein CAOG_02695 [Capsaspora owczarzaki ATCC 30864]|nr:hypothetical protein CAOG_02695 [Capsaspora owczarzaki ATCC 30864]|eukprot:XP_004349445.1 hypothetical protein CAOG_02695 [Capsaspora owczarzaki ATCC 30864]